MTDHAPLILLVEDEAMLRLAAAELLEDMGFRVETVGSAREAMAHVVAAGTGYSAVIIDVGLPDRSGAELAKDIRGRRADIPIVIASGYDESVLDGTLVGDPRVGFLGKPYGVKGLTQAFADLGIEVDRTLLS
jgi:DNA-binding NtrC family response regulator